MPTSGPKATRTRELRQLRRAGHVEPFLDGGVRGDGGEGGADGGGGDDGAPGAPGMRALLAAVAVAVAVANSSITLCTAPAVYS